MNRIVRENYPVSKLPDDLQSELTGVQEVRIVIETNNGSHAERQNVAEARPFSRFRHLVRENFNSVEEIVDQVRALRDEWNSRAKFHERLRDGS